LLASVASETLFVELSESNMVADVEGGWTVQGAGRAREAEMGFPKENW
jgi:hypothetical protein